MNDVEEPRIAILIGEAFAGPLPRTLTRDDGGLERFLGAFPSRPGFALDPIDPLQFHRPGVVEIPDRRKAPFLPNLLQVIADRRLDHFQLFRDGLLGPALEIELRDLLTAFNHRQGFTGFDGHCWFLNAECAAGVGRLDR